MLAPFPSPHFHIWWFKHFSGYFGDRVCGLKARCAPNGSSSALCPLPVVRPSFEAGGVGLCITQDRDRLLSSSTQALKKRYLTFHTSQRFCPIMIFLHCLYLFSSKQPRRPGGGGWMLCPQPRGRIPGAAAPSTHRPRKLRGGRAGCGRGYQRIPRSEPIACSCLPTNRCNDPLSIFFF